MFSTLILGFVLGLQHAFEADHLAAMASITTRDSGLRNAARQGASWGLGHGLALLLFGGTVLLIDGVVSTRLSLMLEAAVGLMLVALGANVLIRLHRRRFHFHVHSHGTERHIHVHRHVSDQPHASDPHQHRHHQSLPLRSMVVGMMHGMAGSAALIVFALGSVRSVWEGLGYIVIFGAGSLFGMTALGIAISLPLRWSARSLGRVHNGAIALLGIGTVGLGLLVLQQTAPALITGMAPT